MCSLVFSSDPSHAEPTPTTSPDALFNTLDGELAIHLAVNVSGSTSCQGSFPRLAGVPRPSRFRAARQNRARGTMSDARIKLLPVVSQGAYPSQDGRGRSRGFESSLRKGNKPGEGFIHCRLRKNPDPHRAGSFAGSISPFGTRCPAHPIAKIRSLRQSRRRQVLSPMNRVKLDVVQLTGALAAGSDLNGNLADI
jgi:hypothetical protein